jgi:hypothetical protein
VDRRREQVGVVFGTIAVVLDLAPLAFGQFLDESDGLAPKIQLLPSRGVAIERIAAHDADLARGVGSRGHREIKLQVGYR